MRLPLELDLWGVPTLLDEQSLESALELMAQHPQSILNSGQRVMDVRVLDLRGLPLARLPKDLHQLEGLEALYLSDNGLKRLPDNIGLLPKLKTLSLGRNQISILPESCLELWDSLVYLFLGHNQISSLPFEASYMAHLRVGSIGSNPIPEPIGTVCWMLREYAKEMPERLGYLVANKWSRAHNKQQASLFLEQALALAKQMNEPMIYEAFFEGTWIDDAGRIQWGDFFCHSQAHIQIQRRQLGLSLLPLLTRGACVHPSLWTQNIHQLDLSSEPWVWHWGLLALPLQQLRLPEKTNPPEGWMQVGRSNLYSPKSSSIS